MRNVQDTKKQNRAKKAATVALIPLLFLGMGFSGQQEPASEMQKAQQVKTAKHVQNVQKTQNPQVAPMVQIPATSPLAQPEGKVQAAAVQVASSGYADSYTWDELADDMVPLAVLPDGTVLALADTAQSVVRVDLQESGNRLEIATGQLHATESALETAKKQKEEAEQNLQAATIALSTAKSELEQANTGLADAKTAAQQAQARYTAAKVVADAASAALEQAKDAELLAGTALTLAEEKVAAAQEALTDAQTAKENTAVALVNAQADKVAADNALQAAKTKVSELEATIAANETTLKNLQETMTAAEAAVKKAESQYVREFEFLIALNEKMQAEDTSWTDVLTRGDSYVDSNGQIFNLPGNKQAAAKEVIADVQNYVATEHSDLTAEGVYWKLYRYDEKYRAEENGVKGNTPYALTLALGTLPTASCDSSNVTGIRFRNETMDNYAFEEAGFDIRKNIGFSVDNGKASTKGQQFSDSKATTISLKDAKKTIADYHANIAALEAAKAQSESLQQAQETLAASLLNANAEVTAAEETAETAQTVLEAAETADADAQQNVTDAQNAMNDAADEVAAAEEAHNNAIAETEKAEADLKDATDAVELAETDCTQADAAVEAAETVLADAAAAVEKAEADVAEAETALEQA